MKGKIVEMLTSQVLVMRIVLFSESWILKQTDIVCHGLTKEKTVKYSQQYFLPHRRQRWVFSGRGFVIFPITLKSLCLFVQLYKGSMQLRQVCVPGLELRGFGGCYSAVVGPASSLVAKKLSLGWLHCAASALAAPCSDCTA